jgi:glyoxylase-like metal-dependent hydrolase (beta-lactamase superfamily II)
MGTQVAMLLRLLLALSILAGGPSFAQTSPRTADIRALADGVWLLPGRFPREAQPDGNSLVLRGTAGLIVIDSGRHVEHTQALLEHARRLDLPLVAVINTHWHLDHLGGNALLRDALPRLRVHASAAVRDATRTRFPATAADLEGMLKDPKLDAHTRRMVQVDLALLARRSQLAPDAVIEGDERLALAGRTLRVGVERGVSGGDLWILDEASGTLAVGDFVTLPVPFFDTACAEEWRAAMQRLAALPFERVLPGHGPPMSRAEFATYRTALGKLLDCAAGNAEAATCARGWIADLGALLPAGSERVVQGMLGHYLPNMLRDATARKRACAA